METLSPQNDESVADAQTNEPAAAPAAAALPNEPKPKTPIEHWLKRQFPGFSLKGMLKALSLMEAHAPVPYIAFYAKDSTGGLKSDDLYKLMDAKTEWDEITRRQQHMLTEIQSQGKLTDELKLQIERSSDLDRLEDLYAPFKLKRQTLGVQAREAGLGALADHLWDKAHGVESELAGATLDEKAAPFIKADSKFASLEAVLKGVQDILVERIAESFELRSLVRSTVFRRSKVCSVKGPKAKANSKYSKFFEYQEPIGSLKKSNASHRYLQMRKGWMEDELALSFERPDEGILLEKFEEFACPNKEAVGAEVLVQAARLALKGNVYTVMENEAHRHLKEEAEKHVIEALAENLRKKLLRPGFGRKAVMGIDPGSANHPCSLALVDEAGKSVLNLQFKMEELTDSKKTEFLQSLENLKIEAIAVAHGPRAKEIRDAFKKILEESQKNIPLLSIHEHSASLYASSPTAKEEFASLDMNTRRAIFVARYLQDPLSIILKIDPKFLSLGELHHEVNQNKLRQILQRTMDACVNFVGVDPNHAAPHVIARVNGLNADLAKAIVAHRESAPFKTREDLKKVSGMNEAFEYSAGFLRFEKSEEKLDCTFVHPKFYAALRSFAASHGADLFSLSPEQLDMMEKDASLLETVGANNLKNIRFELTHAGEDPRGLFQDFSYDPALKTIADLKPNTYYPGVVTNVTSFGAFVDIGIEQDGLVHISELTEALAKNPFDTLFPGDLVNVRVTNVNEEKKQISLTMKNPEERGNRGARRPRGNRPPRHKEAPAGAQAAGADGAAAGAEQNGDQPRGRRPYRGDRQQGDRAQGGGRDRHHRARGREDKAEGGPGAPGAGGPGQGRGPRSDKDKPQRPKRPPQRDSKTGALMKFDENEEGRIPRGGPKLPSKAKPHTFNPFANLANILKDKGKNEGE